MCEGEKGCWNAWEAGVFDNCACRHPCISIFIIGFHGEDCEVSSISRSHIPAIRQQQYRPIVMNDTIQQSKNFNISVLLSVVGFDKSIARIG